MRSVSGFGSMRAGHDAHKLVSFAVHELLQKRLRLFLHGEGHEEAAVDAAFAQVLAVVLDGERVLAVDGVPVFDGGVVVAVHAMGAKELLFVVPFEVGVVAGDFVGDRLDVLAGAGDVENEGVYPSVVNVFLAREQVDLSSRTPGAEPPQAYGDGFPRFLVGVLVGVGCECEEVAGMGLHECGCIGRCGRAVEAEYAARDSDARREHEHACSRCDRTDHGMRAARCDGTRRSAAPDATSFARNGIMHVNGQVNVLHQRAVLVHIRAHAWPPVPSRASVVCVRGADGCAPLQLCIP